MWMEVWGKDVCGVHLLGSEGPHIPSPPPPPPPLDPEVDVCCPQEGAHRAAEGAAAALCEPCTVYAAVPPGLQAAPGRLDNLNAG